MDKRTYTLIDIVDKLEKMFVQDASMPLDKREYASILLEELRGKVLDMKENVLEPLAAAVK